MFLTIPTLLTWARVAAIPLIVGVFYLPLAEPARNQWATALFLLCAVTDWLDGYLARKLGQTSSFGAFLDPVADKFLVCACMLALVRLHRADLFVALIIIGREIAISAVHMVGKLKTAAQMGAIAFLLFDGTLHLGPLALDTRWWGTLLLWIAAVLTVWSMAYYLQKSVPEIRKRAR